MPGMIKRKTKNFTLDDYIKLMEEYVEKVRREETPEQSKEVLIRIGVFEKDGKTLAEKYREKIE